MIQQSKTYRDKCGLEYFHNLYFIDMKGWLPHPHRPPACLSGGNLVGPMQHTMPLAKPESVFTAKKKNQQATCRYHVQGGILSLTFGMRGNE